MYRFTTVEELREEIFRRGLQQYIIVAIGNKQPKFYEFGEERLLQIAAESDATMLYSFYRDKDSDGTVTDHPLIDYQPGSLRDDFDFGSVVVLNCADVITSSEDFEAEDSATPDGGWYALRLRLSIVRGIICIPEYLYETEKLDSRHSGERQHDYVDPRSREYQRAMEQVCTDHLYEIGALLDTEPDPAPLYAGEYSVEASVVIPVRNRVNTVGDAVRSALAQRTDFEFNVIVVDNGSTDGTSELLKSIEDSRLIVITLSDDAGMGIGGCWNKAAFHERCGRFMIQLDSDDLYSDTDVLQRIIDKFYEGSYGMVIGSYRLTDPYMNPLDRPLIDHSEWSDENGRNNALRINGFGAPRAFLTLLIRQYNFPNTSYGEDYAMALRISREWKVGRIFDCLYLCRRWDGNSDAHLTIEKENAHNRYKDFIRSLELLARFSDFDNAADDDDEDSEETDQDFDDIDEDDDIQL